MTRSGKNLNFYERVQIETLLLQGCNHTEIARILRRSRATIVREISRIKCVRNSRTDCVYKAEIAQKLYEKRNATRGAALKIDHDLKGAKTLETLIKTRKWSPAAALFYARSHKLLRRSFCVQTLYNYIEQQVLNLSYCDLPMRAKQRRKHNKSYTHAHKRLFGSPIEARPEEVLTRETFGHWEGDLIVGARGTKAVCLTLLERKTRYVATFRLKDKRAQNVVEVLNRLERTHTHSFSEVFKSITFDNGSEFAYFDALERSCVDTNKLRCRVYYAHPYRSCERASNENCNRLLRRAGISKHCNIAKLSEKQIARATSWVNTLPRKILGYRCAEDVFKEELEKLFSKT